MFVFEKAKKKLFVDKSSILNYVCVYICNGVASVLQYVHYLTYFLTLCINKYISRIHRRTLKKKVVHPPCMKRLLMKVNQIWSSRYYGDLTSIQ